MKLRIIKLLASFLVMVLGATQEALGKEAELDFANLDQSLTLSSDVLVNHSAEHSLSAEETNKKSEKATPETSNTPSAEVVPLKKPEVQSAEPTPSLVPDIHSSKPATNYSQFQTLNFDAKATDAQKHSAEALQSRPTEENSRQLTSQPPMADVPSGVPQWSIVHPSMLVANSDSAESDFDKTATDPSEPTTPERDSTAEQQSSGKKVSKTEVLSSSATTLFASKKSPGSIAVGAAEGNFTLNGRATRLYLGHIDPGNKVVNRGFCSWNRAKLLTVAQADRRCLTALQRQSAAVERRLTDFDIDPQINLEALVNGTDLWNQSNSAGPKFASKYKFALNKGLKGRKALLFARVEAFRNSGGILDASGLFKICSREPYFKNQLRGLEPFSETWRSNCIAIDQGRRIKVVSKALKRNLNRRGKAEEQRSRETEEIVLKDAVQPTINESIGLNFEPVLEPVSSPSTSAVTENQLKQEALETHSSSLDFSVNTLDVQASSPRESADSSKAQLSSPSLSSQVLEFVPSITPDLQPTEPVINKTPKTEVNSWTSKLKKKPKIGEKVAGYVVTSRYGYRVHPLTGKLHFHGGVDLATPTNTLLYAIGKPGTKTTLKCWFDAKGGGLIATMTSPSFPKLKVDALHLSWCRGITNGAMLHVPAGGIIGGTGNTGFSTAPHLHLQLRNKQTGLKIPPRKGHIWWVLTGKEPKSKKN